MNMGGAENKATRDFWVKRLTTKQNELAVVETELDEEGNLDKEHKLTKKAERLLKEIETVNNKLTELDKNNNNSNVSHLSLDRSFQKIDFSQAKKIAEKINNQLGDNSGAILIFLQRTTKQKGRYCINEFLNLIISDRKVGDDIIGDFRPYPIDLGSSISEFNEVEFSRRLASHLSNNTEESLKHSIKKLCSSLGGGSTVFIQIENWDSVLEQKIFLDWFMINFWQNVINELNLVFNEYSKIRFIVALIAKSKVFSDCCSLEYFCSKTTIDHRKIIELPLPDWTVEDIKRWLITNLGLSNPKSLQLAKQIHRESEGTPDTICSILERIYKEGV
jgi:hypothetical protein